MAFEVSRVKRQEERTRLGVLAVEYGLLSPRELEALLQKEKAGRSSRLGELLVTERYVSASLLHELLDEQRRRRKAQATSTRAAPQAPTARLDEYLQRLRAVNGQELLLMTGRPPGMRVPDVLQLLDEPQLTAEQLDAFAAELFTPAERERVDRGSPASRELDHGKGAFRVTLTASAQGRSLSLRPVGLSPRGDGIPLPEQLAYLAELRRGLVIIAGPSSVHRAAVLAKLIDRINETRRRHVISIERRPTYEHRSKLALVAQREVGVHTASYERALRATLREDPDVLAIGEIRGAEAIATALLSAETGHLVICSLHATSPSQAFRRLIDIQGTAQRALVRATLAATLQAVVTLEVVPGREGRHLVVDVLPGTSAIDRMIREDRLHQIDAAAATQPGAVSRDEQLQRLVEQGKVARLVALEHARDCARLSGVAGPRVVDDAASQAKEGRP